MTRRFPKLSFMYGRRNRLTLFTPSFRFLSFRHTPIRYYYLLVSFDSPVFLVETNHIPYSAWPIYLGLIMMVITLSWRFVTAALNLSNWPTLFYLLFISGCKSTRGAALKFRSAISSTGPWGWSSFTNENSLQSQEGGRSFSSAILIYDTREHISFGS